MCTAIRYCPGECLFGRNLDLEHALDERVIVCPRAYPLPMRRAKAMTHHHAMIGVALNRDGFPLYYDAVNEHGLAMAALHFPGHAAWPKDEGRDGVLAPFELIPSLLGSCATISQARTFLASVKLCDIPFSETILSTPLHFMLAAQDGALVVEQTQDGLHIYDNPVGVMSNSPAFPYHMQRLCDFMGLHAGPAETRLLPDFPLEAYSRGMGAMGLPGDLSSSSRFVRAAFALHNSRAGETLESRIAQFFHLLDFVAFPRGSVRLESGLCEITSYSSCMHLASGIYYYKTYENSAISAVDLRRENLDSCALVAYPLHRQMRVTLQNGTQAKHFQNTKNHPSPCGER